MDSESNSLDLQKIQSKVSTLLVEWEEFKRKFDTKPRSRLAETAAVRQSQKRLHLKKPMWRLGSRALQSLSGTPRNEGSEVNGLLKKCLSLKAQLSASLHGAENESNPACLYMLGQARIRPE